MKASDFLEQNKQKVVDAIVLKATITDLIRDGVLGGGDGSYFLKG